MRTRLSWAFGLMLLSGLAHAGPVDVSADIIWNDDDAKGKCPRLCSSKSLYWTGMWRKSGWVAQYTCTCDANAPPQQPVSAPHPVLPLPQLHLTPPPPTQVQLPGGTVTRYDFVDFHNASDLRNVSSPSFEQCASVCIAAPDCGAVTFAADQRRCYLKAGPGNPLEAPSGVSGVITSRASAAK
jgi:hypothetical protein